jgi:phage terminase large subunit-like protein
MAWQLSNVVAREDAKERVYPRKECAENKIDSPVALILAVGRTLVPVKPKVRSVYDLEAEQRAA